MKLSVIGCGYLGAVHAASMASLGHTVVGIDVDAAKIEVLSSGTAPFFEPGLNDILAEGIANGRLRFSTDMADAAGSAVHFIAVGTPQRHGEQSADMTYVDAAISSLIPHLSAGDLVVGKSTVPVGTSTRLAAVIAASAPEASLAWSPEFLREGFAVQDTISPDRLVYGLPVGEAASRARSTLDEVFAVALAKDTPVVVTDYATAELVKAAANAFLATKISFINAMAQISDVSGADVTALADAIGLDARIGRRFLNAGIGFGGGCLPKDIRAFRARAEELGVGESFAFLKEVDAVNVRQRESVVTRVVDRFDGDVIGRRVAILGLAFKPNSDDVRDSPALDIAVRLHGLGMNVVATDPHAIDNARRLHRQLSFTDDAAEAVTGADLVLVLTEWAEYVELDPAEVGSLVASKVVIDGRNCLDPATWTAAGFDYIGIGRR